MNILFCIDHLRPDGTQRALLQLVEGLARRGHRLSVLCLNDSYEPALLTRLRALGATVRVIGRAGVLGGWGLAAALAWLRRSRFDVAVTLLFAADVLGRTLARLAGVPRIISSLRARNVNYRPWQLWLVRATMPWADRVVINSRALRDFAVLAEGAVPGRIVYIPNGVQSNHRLSPEQRAQARAELGVGEDVPLIGAVGRLTHQKGFDLLIDALDRLDGPDAHLLLIGRGEAEAQLRNQAGRLGLAERVHFAGQRRDVPRLLGALDLYAHPARFEGMPNALLEAVAAGRPVVASAVDGNLELVPDNRYGWLVPAGNAPALAVALDEALANPHEAHRRAVAAQARVLAEFSVDAMVDAWEEVLLPAEQAPHLSNSSQRSGPAAALGPTEQ